MIFTGRAPKAEEDDAGGIVSAEAHRSLTHLGQHLLTRSDLARLSVPAARILSWLANGWLDQIGVLPDGRSGGDPVFTVQTKELRAELAQRLATLGKTSVVFTSLRVRSLLLRAMLTEHMPGSHASAVAQGADKEPLIELGKHLEFSDLRDVLQEAIVDLQLGTEEVRRIAEEEAALEAAEVDELAEQEPPGQDQRAEGPVDGEDDGEDEDGLGYFDADDLVDQLDTWQAADEPAIATASPDASRSAAANEPADEDADSFGPTPAELDALRDAIAASLSDVRNADVAFGPSDVTVELPKQSDFADSIARLSATLEEVQQLANEAAGIGETITDADRMDANTKGPTEETLAELDVLDDPFVRPTEEAPSVEALTNAADSIFDQLTMLDDPQRTREGDEPGAPPHPQQEEEETMNTDDAADAVPVEATMVELEALDPRDVLPEFEPTEASIEEEEATVTAKEEPDEREAAVTDSLVATDTEPQAGEPAQPTEMVGESSAPPSDAHDAAARAEAAAEPTLEAALDAVFGSDEQTDDGPLEVHAEPAASEEDSAMQEAAETMPEPVAPAAEVSSANAVEPAAVIPAAPAPATMPAHEVQSFLNDLRESLVELARAPAPPPTDFAPVVAAVREGFERSQQELAQTNVAIGSLVNCVGDLGKRLSHRVALPTTTPGQLSIAVPGNAAASSSRSTWVLLSVCLLIMCWSAVLWWKTGNVRLSVGTLLGANAVACCLLVGRRGD